MSEGARTARIECIPGLEAYLYEELDELGVAWRPTNVGALADATPVVLAALDAGCFCADRVRIRLGRASATTLDALAAGVRALPWRQILDPRQEVHVVVRGRSTKLRRGPVVSRKIEHAIRDAMRGPRGLSSGRPPGPHEVLVELEGDKGWVWADAGGGPLHKRGWRPETAKAPLRETVAAAILRAARWSVDVPLVDPMCGAGTFGIEAARRAAGLPPGLDGRGAWTRWPMFAKVRTPKLVRPTGRAVIRMSDRDPGAVQAAIRNARRAGVGERVWVEQAHLADLSPPVGPPGLLVVNPPWGHRIADPHALPRMVASWAQAIPAWAGWDIAWLLPDPRLVPKLGPGFSVTARFRHGGVPVVLATRLPRSADGA